LELARALARLPEVEPHLSISRQCEIADDFRALGLPTFWVDTYTDMPSCLLRSACLPALAWRMRRFVRDHRIEVVNSTMTHLWTRLLAPVLRQAGPRLLCTVHDATLHPGEDGPFKRWFYAPVPGAEGYIALTAFVADRMAELHAIPRERIAVVPHGVTTFDRSGVAAGRSSGEPLRLLFFGRILSYKGLANLLAAYETLRVEGRRLTLHIAGAGELGPLAETMAELPDVTVDQGWIPEDRIPQLLSQADAVVLPYLEASQSGVIPAAFGMGVPAIVTPVGGLTEQVRDGVNGLVAKDTSPESLAQSLRRLADEPHLIRLLQAGASQTARGEMNWSNVGQRIAQFGATCRGTGT
jgi:glycosyltransferase involved in cell wall biosynthesis